MLFVELAVLQKGSKKILKNRDLSLDSIFLLPRLSHLLKIQRDLSHTKQINDIDSLKSSKTIIKSDIGLTPIPESSSKPIKRSRGRPKKIKTKDSSNLLDKYTDIPSYLRYASFKKLKPTGTVFVGNLYELQVKKFLEEKFKIRNTLHQGGSNDKGIDINAIWEPTSVIDNDRKSKKTIDNETSKQFEMVNSKKVKPIVKRTSKTLKLFVQCKCFNTAKVDPKLIREIKGTSQEYFKKHGNSAVFMLASTNGFTKIGRSDFDKAPIPLIYAKFSKPKLIEKSSPHDINSWELGTALGFYLNPLATCMFKGLDWIKFTKKIT